MLKLDACLVRDLEMGLGLTAPQEWYLRPVVVRNERARFQQPLSGKPAERLRRRDEEVCIEVSVQRGGTCSP